MKNFQMLYQGIKRSMPTLLLYLFVLSVAPKLNAQAPVIVVSNPATNKVSIPAGTTVSFTWSAVAATSADWRPIATTSFAAATGSPGAGPFSASHTYNTVGNFEATLQATNSTMLFPIPGNKVIQVEVYPTHLKCANQGKGPEQDWDCDGVKNRIDVDDDNDGILDKDEGCTNSIGPYDPNLAFIFVGRPSKIYTTDINSGSTAATLIHSFTGITYNAVAINEDDGYFWALREQDSKTQQVDILNPDGWDVVASFNFQVPLAEAIVSGGYDITNGWYVLIRNQYVYVIDGNPNSLTYKTLINTFTISNGSPNVSDIAFNPVDGLFYGALNGGGGIKIIDVVNQTSSKVNNISGIPTGGNYGGAYTTSDGMLYVSKNSNGKVYSIDLNVQPFTANFFKNGPSAYGTSNDGARLITRDITNSCLDTDGDGIPDAYDLDSDNDGIPDIIEAGGVDLDNDGQVDGVFVDTDGDGWSDVFDPDNGGTRLADLDTDKDGYKNRIDLDSDGDGITDIIEAGGVDADGDGRVDGPFADTDEDGWSNVFDSDHGGTVLPIPDTDGDGFPNYLDIDSDGDGIVDNIEAQSTAGYRAATGRDQDRDGIDDRYDVNCAPCLYSGGNITGTALVPVNTDGIDMPDYLDLDSDNDGLSDYLEAYDTNVDGIINGSEKVMVTGDIDKDGLVNSFDVFTLAQVLPGATSNARNGTQTAFDFPHTQNPGVEANWRQVALSIRVFPKVFLEGPYVAATGLMTTQLSTNGATSILATYGGLTQPYKVAPWLYLGTETVSASFFATHTDIVDWVLIELRDKTTNTNIVFRRAGFVKADGTVIDTDGTSGILCEGIPADDYYISVRHRNHLGVMGAATVYLDADPAGNAIDFTTTTTLLYGNSNAAQLVEPGTNALHMGNANHTDNIIKFTGSNNDKATIGIKVNSSVNLTNTVIGYSFEDIDLNGVTSFTGSGNDKAKLGIKLNTAVNLVNTITEQLP